MIKATFILLVTITFLLYPPALFAGEATLSWVPPTTNEDSTRLTDLSGYKIYDGTSSGNYTRNINVGNVTTYTVANLTDGLTYYFAVRAVDTSLNESVYSNEVSKAILSFQQYTLTVTKAGSGTGTVISSPARINCGSACSTTYQIGTTPIKVILKAKADSMSYFKGWDGACTGAKPTCTVTMDNDKDVIASFAPNPMLTLAKSGDGNGTIKTAPKGVNCGIDCLSSNAQFKYKIKVTLKVSADAYSTFLGWGGDCEARGTKSTCTIIMDADKAVTARFGLPQMSVSPTTHDFGSIEIKQSSTPALLAIHNSGIGNLEIDSIKILGTDKKMFKIVGSKKTVIPPGDDCEYTIIFKPVTTGLKNATVEITSNDPHAYLIEIPVSGFGCTDRTDKPRVKVCRGTIAQCLSMQCGWSFDPKAVSDPNYCDASVVHLPDGRYRMYGNYDTARGVIETWISQDGIIFEKEPGSRLTGFGIIWPSVVILSDGRFRMYYTDQSNPLGSGAAKAIKSAISTDGLNFILEGGARLTYLGSGYESDGIRNAKILTLEDGTYRMYYSALSNDVDRVLSAVSSDGLNWVREQGVRLDPQLFCPANTRVMGPGDSFIDSNGVLHQYIWTVTCKNQYYKDAVAGLYELTSIDGLTFNIGATPVLAGYYFKDCYKGKPDYPGMRMDNAPVIMTPEGLRAYLFAYNPQGQCTDWTGGYYSILNLNIR